MSAATRAALARSVRVEEIMGMPISIHVLNESGTLSPTAERAVELLSVLSGRAEP